MKKIFGLLLVVLVVSLVLVAIVFGGPKLLPLLMNKPIQPQTQQPEITTQETEISTQESQQMDPAVFEKQEENKGRLTQACLTGKDCIQSIDNPKFVSAKQAAKFLKDDDMVIGMEFVGWEKEDDPVKAYPIKIMNYHEVVNDFLNETPVAITYCPLCNSAAAYERTLDGAVTLFGVSGSVLNDNLVLYDKTTETLWTQLQGYSLVGKSFPQNLKSLPVAVMTWGEWRAGHPQTMALSTETGFEHDYDISPYSDYAESPRIEFPVEHSDAKLPNKDMVYGVQMYDMLKAYPVSVLQKAFPGGATFDDDIGGHPVKITYSKGKMTLVDPTNVYPTRLQATPTYWYCWVAMYPQTDVLAEESLKMLISGQ